jgi:signal transduction histidine kinase
MPTETLSNTLPETGTPAQIANRKGKGSASQQLLVLGGSLAFIGVLATWALATYQQPTDPYVERAVFLFPLLILSVDLGTHWFAYWPLGQGNSATSTQAQRTASRRALTLPQITLPLYLACAVLLGLQIAVLAALLIEGALQSISIIRRIEGAREAIYRVAANGLVVLAGGGCYHILVGIATLRAQSAPFALRLGTAVAGALVMFMLCPLPALPSAANGIDRPLLHNWLHYFRTSKARFQLLLLSIGPLLPMAAVLDDLEAEVAWVLFLVPLFAIYYLAVVSLRFQRQTEELQASLQALRQARRRQEELRDYAALVTRAQEDERRRLSRELHDDTAQALVALSRGLEALADVRSTGRTQADEARWVEDLRELADRSLDSVRRACRDLRPSVLDDLGLAAALDWLAGGTAQRGLPCTLHVEGKSFPVPSETELVFFRIAQEALANAWRHAQASKAEVLLEYQPGMVRLYVQDNGRGFDVAQAEQRYASGGLGLLGMRERAALVGAEIEIISKQEQGTMVKVQLVLPPLS